MKKIPNNMMEKSSVEYRTNLIRFWKSFRIIIFN